MPTINLRTMEVDALLKLRTDIDSQLAQRRVQLEKELARLGDMKPAKGNSELKSRSTKGRKLAAKYRSRKDPKLTWAGRGATPLWMREEMKGTKLKPDAFLIK